MRLVVETLIRSIPAVFNVIVFGAFLFGIFAILGTQLFMGSVSRCNQDRFENGSKILNQMMCVPGEFSCNPITDLCYSEGDIVERWWGTPFRNFDHIGRSLLTLFVIATLDGFMETAYALMDAVGPGEQPEVRADQGWILFVKSTWQLKDDGCGRNGAEPYTSWHELHHSVYGLAMHVGFLVLSGTSLFLTFLSFLNACLLVPAGCIAKPGPMLG